MAFSLIKKKNKTTITLVMQLLKEAQEDKVVDLVEDLEVQISLIFLKIFLVILEVEEDLEVEEALVTEVPI